MISRPSADYDVVVIGSGFGGCMAAVPLVERGLRVLMVERGGWVERGAANWGDEGVFVLTPHYLADGSFSVRGSTGWKPQGVCNCVGGPSVFYGGASFRFRREDFMADPEIANGSAARWPIAYEELERYYGEAEALLGVAGEAGIDPTEPPRSGPYPRRPIPESATGRVMAEAAASLGMRPFRIPMAIEEDACQACTTCDAFACAVEAKNDLATRVIPGLLAGGMELRPRTAARRIEVSGTRVRWVELIDETTRQSTKVSADHIVLAAGALGSAHLVLASGMQRLSPAADSVGRYLMRHCNAFAYGFFPGAMRPESAHHKDFAIHDFYFGDPERSWSGKLGNLQQVMTPPLALARAVLPTLIAPIVATIARNLTGILAIAEDQPQRENRVELHAWKRDASGMPVAQIHHRYTGRDLAARRTLLRRARQILREAGARFTLTWRIDTFSHAVGTLRMGDDPNASPLDRDCRYRGVDNLWVSDGSVFPTSAGVNPSLTIAANALRVGNALAAA